MYAARARSNWLQPQLVITFALLPLNFLFFGKNSLIGPLANCIAIPLGELHGAAAQFAGNFVNTIYAQHKFLVI